MLLNLLSNAIKFTLNGGRVSILCKVVSSFEELTFQNPEFEGLAWGDKTMIEVQVQDTGVGISQED